MYKVIICAYILILLNATLGGCATTNEVAFTEKVIKVDETSALNLPALETGGRPEWLGGNSAEFPKSTFILLNAQGNTANDAATAAYNKIVKLLHPLPEAADIKDLETEIRIAGLWQYNYTFHALAIFPRELAEDYLKGKLDTLDAETDKTVAEIEATNHVLTRIGLLYSAIERQKLRATYQKSLKKVDLEGCGRESPWDTLKWSNEATQLIAALSIQPITDQNAAESESLLKMLENGLIKAGIESTEKSAGDRIEGGLQISYEDMDNGWVQARGILGVQLINSDSTSQVQ